MNNIDDIIKRLEAQHPTIEDEDTFIDAFIDSLPELPAANAMHEDDGRALRFITLFRYVTSTAAVWLIGLFIYQMLTMSNATQTGGNAYASRADAATASAPTLSCLRNSYKDRQNKTITYTELKRRIHENY